jgi:hypothetical protein
LHFPFEQYPTDITTGTINRWYEEQAENVRRFVASEDLLNRLN